MTSSNAPPSTGAQAPVQQLSLNIEVQRGNFQLYVNQALPTNGITAIFGPSGCGKTTLLRTIAGLETNGVSGSIHFGDTPWLSAEKTVAVEARNIGFVFQRPALFPHLTVAKNLEFAWRRAPAERKAHLGSGPQWVAELTGITELLQHKPVQLSGGQQQRVAIARTLLSCPQLLLMDEPFANLDRRAKLELIQVLQRIQQALQVPILYVSHHTEEVLRLADHLVLMERGKIILQGDLVSILQSSEGFARFGGENVLVAYETAATHQQIVTNGSKSAHPDLLALEIAGQRLLLPNPDWQQHHAVVSPQRRLLIAAQSIGLAREVPQDTSISNALPASIAEILPALHPAESRVVLELADGQRCSALITKQSLQRLQLQTREKVYMLVKAVASH